MKMAPRERIKALILGIQQDHTHYHALTRQLQQQHTLLARHDVTGLNQQHRQQIRLMSQIRHQAQLRCQHLQALGLHPDKQGMTTLISKLPESLRSKVSTQWQQLEQLLHLCQRQNDSNGRLLAGQIETIHTLLGQEPCYAPRPYPHD